MPGFERVVGALSAKKEVSGDTEPPPSDRENWALAQDRVQKAVAKVSKLENVQRNLLSDIEKATEKLRKLTADLDANKRLLHESYSERTEAIKAKEAL
eukprot:4695279-Alexandrium_andersonii.AAC.1